MPLPIEPLLPDVQAALRAGTRAVLVAPPGAGKTTRVPLALVGEPWMQDRRLVMLEPRRLAARAAAHRMAETLGERVGATVGYRIRLERRVSSRTRIEVVTEGILTRMLQDDPALEGVGAVVFDEYHERSLPADLGLALTLQAQSVLRDDLRVLVMSATLDGARVADLLAQDGRPAPVVESAGRSFPVETRYLDREVEGRLEPAVAAAVRRALAEEEEGDVLAFLPGEGEIRRTAEALGDAPPHVRVRPLYGNLSQPEQDAALAPSPPPQPGQTAERKVVLATSIAETSLTIEGVRVVVDGGWRRVPRFDVRSGMTRLETVRVSKASADQRRGRAGRLGPGVCYRLWTRARHAHLADFDAPEILDADLAPLALELALWGTTDADDLAWLDPPPAAALAGARELLRELGALDADGHATEHGQAMARFGLHPRLAHLLLRARDLRLGPLACDLAALLTERDVLRGHAGPPDPDVRLRLEALHVHRSGGTPRTGLVGVEVRRRALARVARVAADLRRRLGERARNQEVEVAGALLALAYPDRVGQLRPGAETRYRLRDGQAVALPEAAGFLAEQPFLAVGHVGGRGRELTVFLASPVSEADLERHFGDQIEEAAEVAWDDEAQAVAARRLRRLGALVLHEAPVADPDPDAVLGALLDGIRAEGLRLLPWTKNARRLRERLAFLHRRDSSFPGVSDEALLGALDRWLAPYLLNARRASDLQRLNLVEILLGLLTWPQRQRLDAEAPSHLVVPSGSKIPIDYADPEAPVLAVRLQEVFGMTETPRVGGVPLTVHLLSPAHRPVQVTQDLASFWADAYFDVRKDLRGRYPKHYWPENPLEATPTSRAKRRR